MSKVRLKPAAQKAHPGLEGKAPQALRVQTFSLPGAGLRLAAPGHG